MIAIDTSAVVAIFRQEPEAARFSSIIGADEEPLISAVSVVELSIVLRGFKDLPPAEAERWLDLFVEKGRLRVVPMTADHVRAARAAHLLFGKGTGHPARLNFGDCCTCALAKVFGIPLLFKGDDFARTDIPAA